MPQFNWLLKMAMISTHRLVVIATILLATMTGTVRGQSGIRWSFYRTADGLPEVGWHTVSFTPQGKLVATRFHASLASELDGYTVSNFPAPVECVGRICESPGGQRWALVPDGLAEFRNDAWLEHPVVEIRAALRTRRPPDGSTIAFLPVRQGTVLVLLPDALYEFLADNVESKKFASVCAAADAQIGRFSGMTETPDEGLWISGACGVARVPGPVRNLGPATAWREYHPPDSLGLTNFTQPMADGNQGVVLMADSSVDGQKVIVTFDGENWAVTGAGGRNFLRAWRGPEGSLLAATATALFQRFATQTNWVQREEIGGGQIFDVTVEPGGAFWLATADGLFRGATPLWNAVPAVHDLESAVHSLASGPRGELYFAEGRTLHELKSGVNQEYPLPATAEDSSVEPVLYPLKNGSLLLDIGNKLFQWNMAGRTFKTLAIKNGSNTARPLGMLADGTVCLYDHPTLDVFDGVDVKLLPNPPPINDDDGALTAMLAARNGDLWFGGVHFLLWRHEDKWQRFVAGDHDAPETAIGFAETEDGKILCATPEGLWEFDGKKWSASQSRFDRINCLMQSRDGAIWLGSDGGLFRFHGGTWIENGPTEGLPEGAVTALCQDTQGKIWAATPRSLAVFHPEADTNPPRTEIRWLAGKGRRLSEGDTLNLLFDGQDKWKITPHEHLFYSYQVDQLGWSAYQDSIMISMASPPAGRHAIQVRTMDRNGNVDPEPATLDFVVVTPWFREARLWVILFLGAASAIFFAGVALNRHRQLVRSHAAIEQKVAERTRELEIATRELLHSQKMNALGTLAAGIAHDFNNILSIIKGSAQIIEDNPDNPEKIQTRVNRIKMVVQQGAEIVDAMLGFGRTSAAPAQPCDVNVIVGDTIKLLGERFLREVEVKYERGGNLPEISTARDFIQQILLNFIFNAAEAMSNRKKIILQTRAVDKLPPDVFLQPTPSASFVLISVQDQGVGMPPEVKARIFEPFFTTKALSTRRGTGLGLSMVYELAKKLGAGLAVQSAVGEGSTFTLILPVEIKAVTQNETKTPVETTQV